ncbi:MAG: hypothetical protein KA175_01175 [Flavobacteriales bacterium]|nr:hypothetical protein [Flavobacteriales bacterium]MBP6696196.1 hypothetical protein [Flavobacteriales bacterium]
MKKALLVVAVACFALATPACKKCLTCKATDSDGDVWYSGEVCGKKDVRDAHESSCNTAATTYGGTCTCDKS